MTVRWRPALVLVAVRPRVAYEEGTREMPGTPEIYFENLWCFFFYVCVASRDILVLGRDYKAGFGTVWS